MSNQIYFCGYRAEHFKNYTGSSATYASIQDTNSDNVFDMGLLRFSDKGIASVTTSNDYSPIYFMFQTFIYGGGYNQVNMSLYDGTNYVKIGIIDDGNYHIYCDVYSGNYDISTNSVTNESSINTSSSYNKQGNPNRIYGKLYSSNGTSYDKLSYYFCIIPDTDNNNISNSATVDIDLTTPLKNITDIIIDGPGWLSYCIVSNFNLKDSYLDYADYTDIGKTSQWSGNTSTFSTYPVNYNSTGGMQGTTNNISQSYTLSKVLNCDNTATNIPVCVINSSNNISTIPYTNGYTGSYDISIPNYLAPGTGISIIFYLSGTDKLQLLTNYNQNGGSPLFAINYGNGGVNTQNQFEYAQWRSGDPYNGWTVSDIPNSLVQNSWNQVFVFNNNGTLTVMANGITSSVVYKQSNTDFTITLSSIISLASIAYTKSSSVSYPFDKDSNVISYIDFADPNNPTIHGDKTQFSIISKSLTASTPISNIPNIEITTNTEYNVNISPYIINGDDSITTTDISTVSSSGSTSTFFMYDNPISKSSWTSADIKNSQFGLTKIS